MARAVSAFIPADSGCLFGTSFGDSTASGYGGGYPANGLAWPPGVSGPWPSDDEDNYNLFIATVGKRPAAVRTYLSAGEWYATGTTTSGTAGTTYGFITSKWRTIMNAGTALIISFHPNGQSWASCITEMKSGGTFRNRIDTLANNIIKAAEDPLNTAAIKKYGVSFVHEPWTKIGKANGGTSAEYKELYKLVIDRFRVTHKIGSGLTKDYVEWFFIEVGIAFGQGATNNVAPNWPGDDSGIKWALADPYNWTNMSGLAYGRVPQPGDTLGENHRYNDKWGTSQGICQSLFRWSDAHPDILIGIGETGCQEDYDRFTIGTGRVLATPKTHSADPHKRGLWYKGWERLFLGLGFTVPNGESAENNFAADTRGARMRMWLHWNAAERFINAKPFITGDKGTAGTPAWSTSDPTYALDAYKAMAGSSVWTALGATSTGGGGTLVGPASVGFGWEEDLSDSSIIFFKPNITWGSATSGTYAWNFGDSTTGTGSATADEVANLPIGWVKHDYADAGIYPVTLTVTDTNGLSKSKTFNVSVVVTNPDLPPPDPDADLFSPKARAPMWRTGMYVRSNLRTIHNAAVLRLEEYVDAQDATLRVAAATNQAAVTDLQALVAALRVDVNNLITAGGGTPPPPDTGGGTPALTTIIEMDPTTIPGVTNGLAIASFSPSSGRQTDPVTQATTAKQPVYQTAQTPNNRGALYFDGTKVLASGNWATQENGPLTVFMCARADSATPQNGQALSGQGTVSVSVGSRIAGGIPAKAGAGWVSYGPSSGAATNTLSVEVAAGTWVVTCSVFNLDNSAFYLNDKSGPVTGYTGPGTGTGSQGLKALVLGANPAQTTGYFKGHIAYARVTAGVPSTAQIEVEMDRIAALCGVTITA